jgi:hypothetical protein
MQNSVSNNETRRMIFYTKIRTESRVSFAQALRKVDGVQPAYLHDRKVVRHQGIRTSGAMRPKA